MIARIENKLMRIKAPQSKFRALQEVKRPNHT